MCVHKKYCVWLTGLLLFSVAGITQTKGVYIPGNKFLFFQQKLDSLPYYISKSRPDLYIYKVCKIEAHSKYYLRSSGVTFSAAAIGLRGSRKTGYINMITLSDIANDFYMEKKYDSASWYWFRALDTAIAHHFDGEELHDMRVGLNNNCFLRGDYTWAMKISTEGLSTAERIGDENRMAHFNNVIGYINMKLRNLPEAEKYFASYLEEARNIRDTVLEAHALYNLGDLAIAEKKYDKAILFFDKALTTYQSIKTTGLIDNQEREGYVSNKLAQCWKLKGKMETALQFARKSLSTTETTSGVNAYDKAEYFINAGDIYNRMSMPDSGIFCIKKGLTIASQINHREHKRDAYEHLAEAFSQKKIYDSAFFYQSMFSSLKDSIVNEISREEIYQRDADLQIERQQQLQHIALQRQKMLRNIIIGIGIFILLTLTFLYNRYRLKQKNRYQQQLNRQQNELFNTITVTQDQERKRIAEDIHDSLGSILSAAKLKLSALKESQPDLDTAQLEKYQVTMQLLDEASAELRNVSHNIMPATLSKLGLVAALRNLINNISSNAGLQVDFSAHDFTERLDEKTEMSIYRIVLELINNIVKHAKATKLTVQLIRYPDHINLSAEDNGCGFDYENELQAKKGIGLGNILSRVNYLQGVIHVDAEPGRGTTVIIDIPYGGL